MTRVASLLVALFFVAGSPQGDVPKSLAPFQGAWVLTSVEGEGLPAGVHVGLTFRGEKYEGVKQGKVDERGSIKVDLAARPMTIDLVITEGIHAGKTQLGLVEVTGDRMTLVLAEPGATVRPTAMTQSPLGLTKLRPVGKELEGSWEGTIQTSSGQTLRLVIKLSNGADGLGAGTLTSVDQGGQAPIAAVVHIGSRIKLIVPGVKGTYDGELKDGQLNGTWSQGRNSTPLVLKKSV
jgi:uncharacterized protein (TIGR03067 family)